MLGTKIRYIFGLEGSVLQDVLGSMLQFRIDRFGA